MTAPDTDDPLVAAATALLGRAPTASERAAMAAQAARLPALYANSLLPATRPVDEHSGLSFVAARDLVAIPPWAGSA